MYILYHCLTAVEGLSIDALKDVEPVCAAIPTPGLQQVQKKRQNKVAYFIDYNEYRDVQLKGNGNSLWIFRSLLQGIVCFPTNQSQCETGSILKQKNVLQRRIGMTSSFLLY